MSDESPVAAAKSSAVHELILALCLLETEHGDEVEPRDYPRHRLHLERAVNAIFEASVLRAVEILGTGGGPND